MNKERVILGIIALVILASSFASANVIIKTIPSTTTWIADGMTRYRMDVFMDARNSTSNLSIEGVNWAFNVPSYNFMTLVNSSVPTTNDFFANYEPNGMFEDTISRTITNGTVRDNSRTIADPGTGPIGTSGYIGSYWFTVRRGATTGWTQFNLDSSATNFLEGINQDPNYEPELQAVQFRIVNPAIVIKNVTAHYAVINITACLPTEC